MFAFLRAEVPRTDQARVNPAIYDDGAVTNQFHLNGNLTTQTLPPRRTRPSPFYPPRHRHPQQQEHFQVISGKGRWHLGNPNTSVDLTKGQNITVGRWQSHTFENLSEEQSLVIGVKYDETSWDDAQQERFFRNTLGHVDDCRKAGKPMSVPQLCLFMYDAGMPVAVCPGPDWIAKWLDWTFTAVMGRVIGEWFLGYRATYPEYYVDPKEI